MTRESELRKKLKQYRTFLDQKVEAERAEISEETGLVNRKNIDGLMGDYLPARNEFYRLFPELDGGKK